MAVRDMVVGAAGYCYCYKCVAEPLKAFVLATEESSTEKVQILEFLEVPWVSE
jgi:hypothetical protein